jgi:hypothetical protein
VSEELDKIRQILSDNQDKDFVQRIMNPDNSPSIDMGKGMKGTHMMATAEADGVHYAYATIQRMEDGSLKRMDPQEAWQEAIANGEVIAFDTAEEALWFSKNYKAVWAKEQQ